MGRLLHLRITPKEYCLAFGNGNTLFATMTNLDVHLTALVHAALVLVANRPELCGRTCRTMGENSPEANTGTRDNTLH